MSGSGRGLDALLADLVAARGRLEGATDPTERAALRDRLHALRSAAAELRGDELRTRPDDDLRALVERCRRELDDLREARFDPSMSAAASGMGGGIDPLMSAEHNQAVDVAGQRTRIESELAAALAELRRRGLG